MSYPVTPAVDATARAAAAAAAAAAEGAQETADEAKETADAAATSVAGVAAVAGNVPTAALQVALTGWTLLGESDFAEIEAADWLTTPPTTLCGVAIDEFARSGFSALGPTGTVLRGALTSTTGSLNMYLAWDDVATLLGRAIDDRDEFQLEVQVPEGMAAALTTNDAQVVVGLLAQSGSYPATSAAVGRFSSAAKARHYSQVGTVTVERTGSIRSIAQRYWRGELVHSYDSDSALPASSPLSEVSASSGLALWQVQSNRVLGTESAAPTNANGRMRVGLAHGVSGSGNLDIELIRLWHRRR